MQKYSCKKCDAELFWDSQSQSLKCEYCNSTFSPQDFEDVKPVKPLNTERADDTDEVTDQSEGLEYLKYQCTNCGAEVVTVKGTVATTCAYCGRALAMTDKLVKNFKPHAVIPFAVPKKQAMEIYTKYCKSSILVPKRFVDPENIKKMKGIYAPFWLHSFTEQGDVDFECENRHSYRVGDDKVTVIHEYRVLLDVLARFEKLPSDGLKKLDNKLMQAVEPFDYDHLEKFTPAYMAGFYAEEYDEDAFKTFEYAYKRAQEGVQEQCKKAVGGYSTKRITSYRGKHGKRKASYAMLPLWLINTEYKGKKYTFAINGDTGKITGELPISILKAILIGCACVLGSYLLLSLFRLFFFF